MSEIRVTPLSQLSADARTALMVRSETDIGNLDGYVRTLIDEVRSGGDAAVRAMTKRFDKVDLGDRPLRVTSEEFDTAAKRMPHRVMQALEAAATNIERGHQVQLHPPVIKTDTVPGVTVGERTLPLASVGLYVPRGKGSFPSVALMLGVPAKIAGVKRPVMVTPPAPDGTVDDATLVAARLVGVSEVYRVGGVQAVAALAYGTQSMPRVPKILGPGNSYVSAAKRVLFGVIDPGIPAGPSEALVYADDSANPDFAARDLLVEAEHGPDSTAVFLTTSEKLAKAIADRLPALINALPEPRKGFITENFKKRSGILLARDEDEALDFINDFAAEHLLLLVDKRSVCLSASKTRAKC